MRLSPFFRPFSSSFFVVLRTFAPSGLARPFGVVQCSGVLQRLHD